MSLANVAGLTAAALISTAAMTLDAPEVWLSLNDPAHGGAADFWDMFAPDAEWAVTERHVQVVEIAQNWQPTDRQTS